MGGYWRRELREGGSDSCLAADVKAHSTPSAGTMASLTTLLEHGRDPWPGPPQAVCASGWFPLPVLAEGKGPQPGGRCAQDGHVGMGCMAAQRLARPNGPGGSAPPSAL